jgi:hypothetical protein
MKRLDTSAKFWSAAMSAAVFVSAAAALVIPLGASAAWSCRLECTAAKRGITSFSCPGTPTEAVCGASPNYTCYEGNNDSCPDNFKMYCDQADCPVSCDTANSPCSGCAAATSTIGGSCSPPLGGKFVDRCGTCSCPSGTVLCLSSNQCVTSLSCPSGYTFDPCSGACVNPFILSSPTSPQSAFVKVTDDITTTTGDIISSAGDVYLSDGKAIHVDAASAVTSWLNVGNWFGGTSANDVNLNVLGSVLARSGLAVGSVFSVTSTGDLAKIKNVSYSWPAANSTGFLSNNGTGGLAWASPTFGGSGDIELFNGQILTPFGGLGKEENWLNYSNSFDNAGWTKTGVSVSADSTAAPDFILTADSISDDATAGGTVTQTTIAAASAGKTYTFSVWLKDNNTTGNVSIKITDNGSTPASTSRSIDPPSGWQRFSVTHTASAGTTTLTATIDHTGGASTSFYAWGAQIELGSSPGVYFSTDSGSASPIPKRGLYGRAGTELNGTSAAGYLSADGTFPSASTQGYSYGLYVRSMTGYTGAGGANTQKYGINVVQTNRFDTYANYALGAYNMSDDQFTAANGKKYGANISNSGVANTEQTGGLLVTEYSTNNSSAGTKSGLRVEVSGAYDGGANATTNYGIYLSDTSTADTNYALYSASTYNSYFAGNVGIGTATFAKKLDVAGTVQGTAADIGVIGNGTGSGGAGVAGYGTAANGKGVYGYGGSNGWGVYGETASGSSVGVLGISTSSTGGQFNTSTGYGAYIVATSTGTGLVVDSVSGYGALFRVGNVGIGNSAPASLLSVGGSSQFQVNSSGNLIKINNVTYNWPAAIAAGVLTSDVSGNLSWSAGGGGGGIGGSGTTNYVPKFTAGTTLGNSQIFDDGTNVGIGVAAPNNTLQVKDLVNFNNALTGTFLGYQAGKVVTTGGTENTFVGYQAGAATTSGFTNLGVGKYALLSNTTGNFNTAIGYRTLQTSTTASRNTALGHQSLKATTGEDNIGLGFQALLVNTTGANNVAVGTNPLFSNLTGSGNTAIGYRALYTTNAGSNTALGYNAGVTITTGTSNTLVGASADVASAALTNATALGAGASVACSNCLVLGNGANVGIGTTAPGTKLDVNGTAKMTGFQLGTSTTAGYVLTADASGVGTWQAAAGGGGGMGGSGTANYVSKFTAGTTLGNSLIQDNGTGVGINAAPNASVKLYVAGGGIGLDNSQSIYFKNSTGTMFNALWADNTNKTRIRGFGGGFQVDDSGGTQLFLVDNTGQTMIGSGTPGAKLDVVGTVKMTGFQLGTSATAGYVLTANASGVGTWQAAGGGGGGVTSVTASAPLASSGGSAPNISFTGTLGLGNGGTGGTTAVAARTNLGLGNVAYTWPGANGSGVLTNNGSGTLSWAAAGGGMGGSGTANYLARFTGSTTLGNSVIQDNGSKVGIGGAPDATYAFKINGGNYLAWFGGSTYFTKFDNSSISFGDGSSGKQAGFINGGHNSSSQNILTLAACDDAGNCPGYNIFLLQTGDVGIRNSAPTVALDVTGQVKISNLASAYATHVCSSAAGSGILGSCSSSRRYKEDIRTLSVSDWRDIFALRPVSYRLKSNGQSDIGLIAEEVLEVMPQLVQFNAEGLPESVEYDKLPLYTVAGLKELDGEINKLKAENADLRQQLNALRDLIQGTTK